RSMDSAGFDVTRWDHWLVISCFVVMAAGGLWACWQFRQAANKRTQRQVRSRLARRLSMEVGLVEQSDLPWSRPYLGAEPQKALGAEPQKAGLPGSETLARPAAKAIAVSQSGRCRYRAGQ
ncbi:MAG: hypothetical protein AAFP03_08440, partial [Cyanobacteria bacterium J06598_3]